MGQLADMLSQSKGGQPQGGSSLAGEHVALIQQAISQIQEGDSEGAISTLTSLLEGEQSELNSGQEEGGDSEGNMRNMMQGMQ